MLDSLPSITDRNVQVIAADCFHAHVLLWLLTWQLVHKCPAPSHLLQLHPPHLHSLRSRRSPPQNQLCVPSRRLACLHSASQVAAGRSGWGLVFSTSCIKPSPAELERLRRPPHQLSGEALERRRPAFSCVYFSFTCCGEQRRWGCMNDATAADDDVSGEVASLLTIIVGNHISSVVS